MAPPSPSAWGQSVKVSRYFVEQQEPVLYEAGFVYDGVLVAVDLLVLNDNKWDVYEVKSSLRLNRTYYKDAAIQYYVLKNWGLPINKFHFVYVNKAYERQEDLNLEEFFIIKDVTATLHKKQNKVREIITAAKENNRRREFSRY